MGTQTILVIGASGHQGGATVHALRDTGFGVRTLLRGGPAHRAASHLQARGVEVLSGDLDNRNSLEAAMRGVHGVFSVVGFRDGGPSAEEVRAKRVADVAASVGVGHLVYSSVGGADRDSGVPHFESKWQVEQYIRRIGIPHSILRPTTFMTNLNEMAGLMRFVALSMSRGSMRDERPLQMIAIRDIGRWAARMFRNPDQYLGAAVEIAGDAVTFGQMIDAYRRVYGSRPRTIRLPLSSLMKGDAGKMFKWISEVGFQADLELNRTAIPDLLTFEQFLELRVAS